MLLPLVAVVLLLCVVAWLLLGALPNIVRAGGITLYLKSIHEPGQAVLRIRVGLTTMTCVADPVMIRFILEDRKRQFDSFGPAVLPLISKLFKLKAEHVVNPAIGEATKEASHKLLQGSEIDGMFDRAVEVTWPILDALEPEAGADYRDIDGVQVLQHLAYQATVTGVFGQEVASTVGLEESFYAYDSRTKLLAAGVPWRFMPEADRSFTLMGQASSRGAEQSVTRAVRLRHEVSLAGGLAAGSADYCNLAGSFFWATLSNTVPTSCWIVFHLAHDPALQDRIYEEIKDVELTRQECNKSLTLQHCFWEVMRLRWDGFNVRTVQDPNGVDVVDSNGRPHHFPCGTQLQGSPFLYLNDPSFFPQPERFRPERWEGIKETPLCFGGGRNACSGRLFVMAEVKMFCMLLVRRWRFEALSPLPSASGDKGGFGVALPSCEQRLRFFPRTMNNQSFD